MPELLGLQAPLDLTEEEFNLHYKPALIEHVYVKGSSFLVGPGNLTEWVIRFFVLCKVNPNKVTVLRLEKSAPYAHPKFNFTELTFTTNKKLNDYLLAESNSVFNWSR